MKFFSKNYSRIVKSVVASTMMGGYAYSIYAIEKERHESPQKMEQWIRSQSIDVMVNEYPIKTNKIYFTRTISGHPIENPSKETQEFKEKYVQWKIIKMKWEGTFPEENPPEKITPRK